MQSLLDMSAVRRFAFRPTHRARRHLQPEYHSQTGCAVVGEHGISNPRARAGRSADVDSCPEQRFAAARRAGDVPPAPEKVPYKYRESEELPKVTVKAGSNKLEFVLDSGPIQPPASSKKKAKSPDAPSCD
jgi:hypothetical protein